MINEPVVITDPPRKECDIEINHSHYFNVDEVTGDVEVYIELVEGATITITHLPQIRKDVVFKIKCVKNCCLMIVCCRYCGRKVENPLESCCRICKSVLVWLVHRRMARTSELRMYELMSREYTAEQCEEMIKYLDKNSK